MHLAVIFVDSDANVFWSTFVLLSHAVEGDVVGTITWHRPLNISAAVCVPRCARDAIAGSFVGGLEASNFEGTEERTDCCQAGGDYGDAWFYYTPYCCVGDGDCIL